MNIGPRLQARTSSVVFAWCVSLALVTRIVLPAPAADVRESGGESLLPALTCASAGRSRRESSSAADLNSNGDSRVIKEGQTLVLADLAGPGAITHLWNTIASQDPFAGRALVLRIYWDGLARPSVEVPLGDFFGVGHGAVANFHSLPVSVSSYGRSRACFWRMPFRQRAKVTLTNEARGFGDVEVYFYVDWEELPGLPEDSLYFHARYHQAFPAPPGEYTVLETKGRGHYVGTVFSVQQIQHGWFGEGDDRFYLDGEKLPSLRGTGTEDYFNDAWGFRTFAAPSHGVTVYEGPFAGDRVSAYRWHLADPVRFQTSLRLAFEHRGSKVTDAGVQLSSSRERADWVSSAAFWYQTPPVVSESPLPPAEKRLAPYRVLPARTLAHQATPASLVTTQELGVLYAPAKPDAEIAFDFEVATPGRYQVAAILVESVFSSRYQPFLDGQPVGPELDLCNRGEDWTWYSFDLHDLAAGRHSLKFAGRGASPWQRTKAASQFAFGMNSLVLLRLEDMAGYEPTAPAEPPRPIRHERSSTAP